MGAVDGRHLLLAEQPEAFAKASVRALSDESLRVTLAKSGWELFDENFRDDAVKARIRTLVAPLILD